MPQLIDLLKTSSLNTFYRETKGSTFAEAVMPAQYLNSFDLKVTRNGQTQVPQIIQASAYDVDPKARDFETAVTLKEDKPFFRERMSLDEQKRKDLLEVLQRNDSNEIKAYTMQIFKQFAGKGGFLDSVSGLVTYMLGQLLSTGTVSIDKKKKKKVIDYEIPLVQRETLVLLNKWDQPTTAKPLDDLIRWKEGLIGTEVAVMSKNTYNMLKNSDQVKELIQGQKIFPTPNNVRAFIEEYTELTIKVWDEKVRFNSGGNIISALAYPDGKVTLTPKGQYGNTEYGPDPTKTDQIMGLAGDRDIADIPGTYATLEVIPVVKGSAVVNMDIVISTVVGLNPTILDETFIATVY